MPYPEMQFISHRLCPCVHRAAILPYIDDITGGGLLSDEPIAKSQQLAWMEFASQLIANIGQLYSAREDAAFDAERRRVARCIVMKGAEPGATNAPATCCKICIELTTYFSDKSACRQFIRAAQGRQTPKAPKGLANQVNSAPGHLLVQ